MPDCGLAILQTNAEKQRRGYQLAAAPATLVAE